MKPPDEVVREHGRQWVERADVDYRNAEWLPAAPEPIRESIGFHCQQAVEKYLKALLVALQVEFPKTHDIEDLIELLSPCQPDVAAELAGAVILSPFGVRIRYPGDFPELPRGVERRLFELAKRTRQLVTVLLDRRRGGG